MPSPISHDHHGPAPPRGPLTSRFARCPAAPAAGPPGRSSGCPRRQTGKASRHKGEQALLRRECAPRVGHHGDILGDHLLFTATAVLPRPHRPPPTPPSPSPPHHPDLPLHHHRPLTPKPQPHTPGIGGSTRRDGDSRPRAGQGISSNAFTWRGRTTAKSRRFKVAMVVTPRRSARAIREASVPPRRRSA